MFFFIRVLFVLKIEKNNYTQTWGFKIFLSEKKNFLTIETHFQMEAAVSLINF